MSIRTMCTKDTITLYLKAITAGTSMGVEYTPTLVGPMKCRIEKLSMEEALDFAARGVVVTHRLFFHVNPGITQQHLILNAEGETLHVKSMDSQGRPGKTLLWIVMAQLKTTRDRQAIDVSGGP